MASTHKELVLRNDQSQIVQKRSSEFVYTAPKKTALDEDSFTENMGDIIKRDFFPDLPKLEMQLEYFEASKQGNYVRMRELSQRLATATRTPSSRDIATPSASVTSTPAVGGESRKRQSESVLQNGEESGDSTNIGPGPSKQSNNPSNVGLDEYLSKYHSEDDASFNELAEKALKKHQAKYSWLYEQEKQANDQLALQYSSVADQEGTKVLAITDGSEKEDGEEDVPSLKPIPASKLQNKSQVETWTYKAKNSLMYVPEGIELSLKERMEAGNTKREIVHSNTRLSHDFLAQLNNIDTKSTENQHKPTGHKVGVDGKVLEQEDEPSVNGYSYVATPVIQPGVEDSPMMTWGTVDGTPLRIEGGMTPLHTSGPSFKMPKAPKREQIGVKLAVKASKAYTERKKKALETATSSLLKSSPSIQNALRTPTPNDRLQLLSPAARKLAQKATPIRSVDRSLRQSYTPSHTPSASPLLKVGSGGHKKKSLSRPSSVQRASGATERTSTAGSTPTPSLLSDNLLKLNS
jgi:protein DGCR14